MKSTRPWKLAALLVLAAGAAHAQTFPSQPVVMTVNFPPAGMTDLAGRALATAMGEQLKQTVIVQNRPGAGGAIGAAAIAAAPKDGYTVGFIATAAVTTLPQMRQVPYTVDSLDYVCRTFEAPIYLLVAQHSRFRTAKDLLAQAKAHPGKINYATVGPGSLPHLAALDLSESAGVQLAHIPYQGEAPAVTDLLGGHVDLYFGTSAVATTHNLRRLAVASSKRLVESPDTPTLSELGYPVSWSVIGGVVAPKGIEPQARAALGRACAEAVRSPLYRNTLANLKVAWSYADEPEFKRTILADSARNRVILRSAKLLAP